MPQLIGPGPHPQDDAASRKVLRRLQEAGVGVFAKGAELQANPIANAVAIMTMAEVESGTALPEGCQRFVVQLDGVPPFCPPPQPFVPTLLLRGWGSWEGGCCPPSPSVELPACQEWGTTTGNCYPWGESSTGANAAHGGRRNLAIHAPPSFLIYFACQHDSVPIG